MLFDMDGTLVDSERVWDVALHELAVRHGGTLSVAARRSMVGRNLIESIGILHHDLGLRGEDPAAGIRWVEDRMVELVRSGLRWRPGAARLLAQVRAAGLPTGLVTSTVRRLTEAVLDTLGRHNFDVVVCGDEVTHHKPHPEPYLSAAAGLGVPIGRCVAIEDSPAGVASARASGAIVVGVPHDVALTDADGIAVFDSLVEVNLDRLVALATAAAQVTG